MKLKICAHLVLLRAILVLFIGGFFIAKTEAKEGQLEYLRNLTLSDGLSHNGVTDLLEDSKGYLWIATFDGLNRYDGHEVKIYKNTVKKELFSSNRIRSIVEDTNGDIWIGTEAGIDLYDYSNQCFKNIYSKLENGNQHNPIILKIGFLKNGNIICLTQKEGFLIFDSHHKLIQQHYPATYTNLGLQFFDFIELDDDFWLFATNQGLLLYNVAEKTFKEIYDTAFKSAGGIIKIDESTMLLLGPSGLSVIKMQKRQGVYSFAIEKSFFESENLASISVDKFNNLWIGTSHKGIIHVDNLDALLQGDEVETAVFKLEGNILRTSKMLSNTSSGCWVGTFNEGLFQFPLKQNPFKHITSDMKLADGLLTNSILSINIIDDNSVSIIANQGGEAIFNTKTHRYQKLPYRINSVNRMLYGPIYKDSRGDIWLGSGYLKKVFRLKQGESVPRAVKGAEDGLDINSLRLFCEDKNGDIWMGGTEGVFRLLVDEKGNVGELQRLNDIDYFKSNNISYARSMYMDTQTNNLWIGTDYQGLFRIDVGDKRTPLNALKIKNYKIDKTNAKSIASNFISCVIRVPNKDLWVGTEGGGIAKVLNSEKEPEFVTFSEADGLSNNVVKQILCDDDDNLWVSTNVGLNKFSTKDERFQIIRKQDGLPFEEFDFAAQRLANGYMVFGGQRGFCYFKPEDIKATDKIPPFQFGRLRLNNKVVLPGDTIQGRVLMDKSLGELNELVFNHDENIFSIELAALHYSNPENYNFKYKLSPLNMDWITIPSSQRNIDFNGLSPGHYQLEVMVSNSLNQWSKPYQLSIIITPPFWKTSLAILLYILILAAIIFAVIKIRSNMLQLKYKFEIEQLEKNKIREVDEAKFKFFSNISHEFKTPLTLISGPIETMLEQYKNDKNLWDKLTLVKRQSKKMSQLVDQVHDFRRSDKNILNLNFSVFPLQEFVEETLADFKLMANDTNKALEIVGQIPDVYIRADKNNLEKVFNNILNNAFKFTKEGDFIRLKASIDGSKLLVQLADSGKGIDKEDLPHVFERFYQSQKVDHVYTGGSGIGLAFSKRLVEMHYGSISMKSDLGHGATVEMELPIVVDKQEYGSVIKDIIKEEEAVKLKQAIFKVPKEERIQSSGEFADATIFLAEDNDDMRLFIQSSLEKYFKVSAFVDGKELLDKMEEEWPDIIISDVLMPELNGFELCSKVKNDIKTGHIPVVLLTACTSAEDQLKGLKTGADLYIKKPFELQHLIGSVENVLQNRKLLRERFMGDFSIGLEKKPGNSADNIFLEKLYKLMSENLDNPELELDNLVRELGLNRTHFYQKVKALTNETPFGLLKTYRLKKAAEYLRQKQRTISEVTAMTGFKSTSHFSRAFKDKYGCSPSKYSKQH